MFRLQVHMLRMSRHEIKFKQKIMRHPFIDKIADTAIIEYPAFQMFLFNLKKNLLHLVLRHHHERIMDSQIISIDQNIHFHLN